MVLPNTLAAIWATCVGSVLTSLLTWLAKIFMFSFDPTLLRICPMDSGTELKALMPFHMFLAAPSRLSLCSFKLSLILKFTSLLSARRRSFSTSTPSAPTATAAAAAPDSLPSGVEKLLFSAAGALSASFQSSVRLRRTMPVLLGWVASPCCVENSSRSCSE